MTFSNHHGLGSVGMKRHNSEMKLRFVVSSTKKNKFERQLKQEISMLQQLQQQDQGKHQDQQKNHHKGRGHQSSSRIPSPCSNNSKNSHTSHDHTHVRRRNGHPESDDSSNNSNQNSNMEPPNKADNDNSFFIGPNGQNVLHYVCQNHPSSDYLQTLLECLHGHVPSSSSSYPSSSAPLLLQPDHDGNLPIHMAMTNGASHETLWTLITYAPHSVHVRNKWGYKAWDWVWERCHYELVTLSKSLGTCDDSNNGNGGVGSEDDSSYIQTWKENVWNTINALVRAAAGDYGNDHDRHDHNHHQTHYCTKRTRTLLHMIADFEDFDCPLNLLQAILDEYPTMTMEKDMYGRVPVAHVANLDLTKREHERQLRERERGGNGDVTKGTQEGDDETLMTTTNTTTSKLPFTFLMIRMLILANPYALLEQDDDGRIAIHMAIDSGMGWKDIVRCMARNAPDSMSYIDPFTNLYPVMMLSSARPLRNWDKGREKEGGGERYNYEPPVVVIPTKVEDIYEAMSFCVQVCCNV